MVGIWPVTFRRLTPQNVIGCNYLCWRHTCTYTSCVFGCDAAKWREKLIPHSAVLLLQAICTRQCPIGQHKPPTVFTGWNEHSLVTILWPVLTKSGQHVCRSWPSGLWGHGPLWPWLHHNFKANQRGALRPTWMGTMAIAVVAVVKIEAYVRHWGCCKQSLHSMNKGMKNYNQFHLEVTGKICFFFRQKKSLHFLVIGFGFKIGAVTRFWFFW